MSAKPRHPPGRPTAVAWAAGLGLLLAAAGTAATLAAPGPAMALSPAATGFISQPVLSQRITRVGPYATLRRAWEVARAFRARGCTTTQPFHSSDGYYVDVRC
jgi:hypothetical protein